MELSSRRTLDRKILIAVLIGNLLFWELFLRAFLSAPSTQIPDADLGYVNQPYARYVESQEGYAQTRFNRLGFNDADPLDLPAVRRIVVLGDSYTEAFQVPSALSYTQLLEDRLRDELKQVDVVKLGRDSFFPLHYPLVLKRHLKELKPELVVVQFGTHSSGDLFADNIKVTHNRLGQVVHMALEKSASDRHKELLRPLISNSALLYYSLRRFKPVVTGWLERFRGSANAGIQQSEDKPLAERIERLVYVLNSLKALHSRIVLLYLPAPGTEMRGTSDNSPTWKALHAASLATGLPLLEPAAAFRAHYLTHGIPLNGFANTMPGTGHLNNTGHRVLSEFLATSLAPRLVAGRPGDTASRRQEPGT